jgi:hypothetical protein
MPNSFTATPNLLFKKGDLGNFLAKGSSDLLVFVDARREAGHERFTNPASER